MVAAVVIFLALGWWQLGVYAGTVRLDKTYATSPRSSWPIWPLPTETSVPRPSEP